jgi:hypothetical protein
MHIDKFNIYGRHLEIYNTIKFLTSDPGSSKSSRILNIHGVYGVGYNEIARYSIIYVITRNHFEEGAFYVDIDNK